MSNELPSLYQEIFYVYKHTCPITNMTIYRALNGVTKNYGI